MKKFLAPIFGLALFAVPAAAQDAAKGKEVFEQCGVCHSADTDEKKMGPALKGLFQRKKLADGKTDVTETTVRKKIDEGGNGMPAYAEMLESKEKANLMAYLKTL